eukprot:scaffold803_cov310-Pinguiococcus_pyrenoidosus.AAC.174
MERALSDSGSSVAQIWAERSVADAPHDLQHTCMAQNLPKKYHRYAGRTGTRSGAPQDKIGPEVALRHPLVLSAAQLGPSVTCRGFLQYSTSRVPYSPM